MRPGAHLGLSLRSPSWAASPTPALMHTCARRSGRGAIVHRQCTTSDRFEREEGRSGRGARQLLSHLCHLSSRRATAAVGRHCPDRTVGCCTRTVRVQHPAIISRARPSPAQPTHRAPRHAMPVPPHLPWIGRAPRRAPALARACLRPLQFHTPDTPVQHPAQNLCP